MDSSQTQLIPPLSRWISGVPYQGQEGEGAGGRGQEESGQSSGGASHDQESSPEKVARRGAELLGYALDREQVKLWGDRVHWVYGVQWGALYSLLAPRGGLISGLAYGAVLWLASDELLLWAIGVARVRNNYPLKTHLEALAAHLVYGAALGLLLRGARD